MRDDRPARTGPALKLRAESEEDLRVVAACLQDAIVPIADAEYLASENCFALVANRFRWEAGERSEDADAPFERVLCGVTIEGVTTVKSRNIDRGQPGGFLNLLTIEAAPNGESGYAIDLTFSRNACIRLVAETLCVRLEDFGEPWPTQWRPGHDDDATPGKV